MGGFMMSPVGAGPAAPEQAPPPPMSPMDTLMGQQVAQNPQMAQLQAQAGALQQLRDVEMAIGSLSQIVQGMAAAYPGGAEPARQAMQALDQAKQAVIGFLVPMMTGMPDAQPPGPPYMVG